MVEAGWIVSRADALPPNRKGRPKGGDDGDNDQEEQNEGADQGQPVSPEPAPGIRPEACLLPRQRIADVLFRGRDAGRGCHLAPSVPDSRVDRRIQEIHEQVGEPDRQRIESEDPDHDVVVPGQNALHELLPQPGDPEDVLDDDAARNDADGERPQNGSDWDKGVAQGVPDDDDAVAQALGLRGRAKARAAAPTSRLTVASRSKRGVIGIPRLTSDSPRSPRRIPETKSLY